MTTTNRAYEARDLVASGDLDGAILLVLRSYGEQPSSGVRGKLGMELTDTRRIAGRLRSMELRGLVSQRYNGFTDTNHWVAS